jgi:hypothetical protein
MGNGTETISLDGEMNLDKTPDRRCEHTLPGGVRSGLGGNLSETGARARSGTFPSHPTVHNGMLGMTHSIHALFSIWEQ